MAEADPGVVVYCLICAIILILFTTTTLLRYRHKSVSREVSIVVWVSWTLCLSITFLLPLDLRPNVEDSSAMLPLYEAIYWICFFLTWVFTPFQQNYVISGGFTRKERIFGALRLSLLFFTIVGIASVIGFIYLIFATNFSASEIGAVAQSFANLWGLSFAIMAMGYGLIEIPRKFWHHSNYSKTLDYLYFVVFQLENEKEEAKDRLDEWLYCYKRCKKYYENKYLIEYNVIQNSLPLSYLNSINNNSSESSTKLPDITDATQDILDAINSNEESKFTKKLLTKMHFWIKNWSIEYEINQHCWFNTLIQVLSLEGVLHTRRNQNSTTKTSNNNNNNNNNSGIGHKRGNQHLRSESRSPSNSPRAASGSELSENERVNLSIEISGGGRKGASDESSLNLKHLNGGREQMTAQQLDSLPFLKQCYLKFQIYGMPYAQKFIAILLSVLTIIVIWSELASVFDEDLSIFAIVVHNSTYVIDVYIWKFYQKLFCFFWICFLFFLCGIG
jgi:phage terminase large subunit-like protein